MRKHSYLSAKCEVRRDSIIHRYGVFAKENIKKGEFILAWGGYIIKLDEIKKLPKSIIEHDYTVQVFENFCLGPKEAKDLDDCQMINYSYCPNAGVKGQIILVARRNIKAEEEVCFDYETTDTQDLKFTCKCGAKNCRGKINGTSWKDLKFQKSNKGYLSFYIQEKINSLKGK